MAAVTGNRSATATLAASTVDTVTLVKGEAQIVQVVHHGDATDVIYVRNDGVDPAVAEAENHVVLPGERATVAVPATGELRLISAGVPTYTVAHIY